MDYKMQRTNPIIVSNPTLNVAMDSFARAMESEHMLKVGIDNATNPETFAEVTKRCLLFVPVAILEGAVYYYSVHKYDINIFGAIWEMLHGYIDMSYFISVVVRHPKHLELLNVIHESLSDYWEAYIASPYFACDIEAIKVYYTLRCGDKMGIVVYKTILSLHEFEKSGGRILDSTYVSYHNAHSVVAAMRIIAREPTKMRIPAFLVAAIPKCSLRDIVRIMTIAMGAGLNKMIHASLPQLHRCMNDVFVANIDNITVEMISYLMVPSDELIITAIKRGRADIVDILINNRGNIGTLRCVCTAINSVEVGSGVFGKDLKNILHNYLHVARHDRILGCADDDADYFSVTKEIINNIDNCLNKLYVI
jgi:hypothetical protein